MYRTGHAPLFTSRKDVPRHPQAWVSAPARASVSGPGRTRTKTVRTRSRRGGSGRRSRPGWPCSSTLPLLRAHPLWVHRPAALGEGAVVFGQLAGAVDDAGAAQLADRRDGRIGPGSHSGGGDEENESKRLHF